jgi:hypothetical protein
LSPVLALIIGAAAAAQSNLPAVGPDPAVASDSPGRLYGPPVPLPTPRTQKVPDDACNSPDSRDIVVCAQRRQGYRLDPSVSEARQEAQSSSRSAGAARPAAQAACAASPMGCGTGLESLDLVNVALVLGTMAVRAAKGEDWAKAFRTGGPDEYQLYLQAKQRRAARDAERAAASMKAQASH